MAYSTWVRLDALAALLQRAVPSVEDEGPLAQKLLLSDIAVAADAAVQGVDPGSELRREKGFVT